MSIQEKLPKVTKMCFLNLKLLWEYWEPIKKLHNILKKINIVDLTNKNIHIKDDLWLVGLDDELAGLKKDGRKCT